jgi:UV DNA damage endonuclease
MFPFASHEKHGYSLEYCADLLKEAGDLARRYGHRLTTHPGQFTQLGSPRDAVRGAAVRELNYHCQMLDLMGVGKDGVMVIHVSYSTFSIPRFWYLDTDNRAQGGGTYGDKAAAIGRLRQTITEQLSPHVRARLVLENDEVGSFNTNF